MLHKPMAYPKPSEELDDELDPSAFKPRSRGGLGLSLTFSGLILAAFLLFDLRGDLAFWVASSPPIELGQSGDYHLDRVADNALAKVQGQPGPVASRFRRYGQSYEIVALKGSPFLVRRPFPGRELGQGKPDQAPIVATGRLLRDSSIAEYEQAFQNLVQKGEAVPASEHLWVLLDGELPRSGWQMPAVAAGLFALLALNALTLLRFFRARAGQGQRKKLT